MLEEIVAIVPENIWFTNLPQGASPLLDITSEESYMQSWQTGIMKGKTRLNVNGFDVIEQSKNDWSLDEVRGVQLRPGLHLRISDDRYNRDLNTKCDHCDLNSIVSKFYVSGHHDVISPTGIDGVAKNYAETAGNSYLFYLPKIEEIEQYHADDRIFRVVIELELDFLRTFSIDPDSMPQLLRPVLNSNVAPQFHRLVGKITPAMKTIIQQIWHSPYQNMVGRMYLESKALELTALQFGQVQEAEEGKHPGIKLKPSDVECLYQARDILIQRYDDPPSLMDLAKKVGVNDCKLKQGFRQVFGTTVFGYLHQHRMEMARELLQDGRLNVGDVAHSVGYAAQGRFAIAFKRKFGITPKECRLGNIPKSL